VPHRQEQSHEPLELTLPEPEATPLAVGGAAAAAAAGGGAAAAAGAEAAGGAAGGAAAGGAALPPVMGDAVPVPFWVMAMSMNICWVLAAVGLMEKVMPFPQ
jgi:hypothetical protein